MLCNGRQKMMCRKCWKWTSCLLKSKWFKVMLNLYHHFLCRKSNFFQFVRRCIFLAEWARKYYILIQFLQKVFRKPMEVSLDWQLGERQRYTRLQNTSHTNETKLKQTVNQFLMTILLRAFTTEWEAIITRTRMSSKYPLLRTMSLIIVNWLKRWAKRSPDVQKLAVYSSKNMVYLHCLWTNMGRSKERVSWTEHI